MYEDFASAAHRARDIILSIMRQMPKSVKMS
jgi:hypothetical protein